MVAPVLPTAVPVMTIGRPMPGVQPIPVQPLPPVYVDATRGPPVPPAPAVLVSPEDVNQLRDMFPSIDADVIKTLLENERGNRDRVANMLLQMSE